MKHIKVGKWIGMAGLLLLLLALTGPVAAQEPNQAGLVVQFDEDRVETWCIAFQDEEIAGNDLLARSGLDVVIDASSGLGITVCQIEGQGCAFPAEHCFCQCMGGEECRYWNYFYREPGDKEWTYSPLGALLRDVQPGAVEAWVWGNGQTPPGDALTFETICRAPTPTSRPVSPTPTAIEMPAPTLSPAARTPLATQPPAATAAATATATPMAAPPSPTSQPAASPTPVPAERAGSASDYFYFGLMALGLLLLGVIVWLQRR